MPTLSNKKSWFRLDIFLWIIFALIWFIPLGYRALIHTDEGRYATIALNTLIKGDWITPRLNGVLYFEKPALQYWCGAILFYLFGVSDFTARLYPAITGFLTVILTAYTAKRVWGKEEGQLAAIICGGLTWIICNSHFLTLDMGVTFFLTATLCSLILSQHENSSVKEQYYWALVMWASMALAMLSKGLIGLLIPGSVLILYSLINKQWKFWNNLQWLRGLTLFFILCAPWLILVSIKNHSFPYFFFIHEHFGRFLTTEHHRAGPIWYFIPVLLAGSLPWTSYLLRLFMNGWQDKTTDKLRTQRLLLIWSVFIFVFFSFSGSKLTSYILPMFPAIALMLAWHLNRTSTNSMKKHLWIPTIVGIVFIVFYPAISYFNPNNRNILYIQSSATLLVLIGCIMIFACLISWLCLNKQKKILATLCLAFGSLTAFTCASLAPNQYITQFKSARDIMPKIAPYIKPDTQVFAVRYYDQTLPFYLRRNVTLVDYRNEFSFGEDQEPNVWIPKLSRFIKLWNKLPTALAIMEIDTYNELKNKGLAMNILYKDARRIVVSKP